MSTKGRENQFDGMFIIVLVLKIFTNLTLVVPLDIQRFPCNMFEMNIGI